MLGVDIVAVARIEKASKNPRFLSKLFTERELAYYHKKSNNPQTLSGMFATKEAVSKVLGTGFVSFSMRDIEVLHEESGAPYVVLHGNAENIRKQKGNPAVAISISHEREYAVAVAMLCSQAM